MKSDQRRKSAADGRRGNSGARYRGITCLHARQRTKFSESETIRPARWPNLARIIINPRRATASCAIHGPSGLFLKRARGRGRIFQGGHANGSLFSPGRKARGRWTVQCSIVPDCTDAIRDGFALYPVHLAQYYHFRSR